MTPSFEYLKKSSHFDFEPLEIFNPSGHLAVEFKTTQQTVLYFSARWRMSEVQTKAASVVIKNGKKDWKEKSSFTTPKIGLERVISAIRDIIDNLLLHVKKKNQAPNESGIFRI